MTPEGKAPKSPGRKAGIGDNAPDEGYLDGQMLIAMPVMGDPRFERSVIYLCAHSAEGAMGIIVNHPAGSIDFPQLLMQLDIIKSADQIKVPDHGEPMQVLKGGPVDTGRGFVLHSSDFFIQDATLRIDDDICLTATVDILKAIAKGAGPKHAILALGYAGWAPASWKPRSSTMAGCIARPIPTSCSAAPLRKNIRARCARSASIPACCRAMRGTPSRQRHPGCHPGQAKREPGPITPNRHCYAKLEPRLASTTKPCGYGSAFAGTTAQVHSAACCATVGAVPATVARRMSRGCDWS